MSHINMNIEKTTEGNHTGYKFTSRGVEYYMTRQDDAWQVCSRRFNRGGTFKIYFDKELHTAPKVIQNAVMIIEG